MVALVLIGIVLPQCASANCGYEGVSVSGTVEEVADACRALDEVLLYFKKIGVQPDAGGQYLIPGSSLYRHVPCTLMIPPARNQWARMRSQGTTIFVAGDSRSLPDGVTSRGHEGHGASSGANRLAIQFSNTSWCMLSSLTNWAANIKSRKSLARVYRLFRPARPHGRELKSKVLANYPNVKPFQFPESVNPITYAADPDEFGISAYLFTELNGGPSFIGQIIAKEVPFSTEEFEFLWVE